jgi:transcription antitermination factor NusG
MRMSAVSVRDPANEQSFPLALVHLEKRWYVTYTCPNHEKRVAEQLSRNSVEQFLPLYESVRRWKDRRVQLQLPLFPSYVFVRIELRNQLRVLQIPGVVRLVSFNGRPTAVPDAEIGALREALTRGLRAKPHPYLTVGRSVEIRSGPFKGLMGRLLRAKTNWRIVISFESFQRAILAEIDAEDIEFAKR